MRSQFLNQTILPALLITTLLAGCCAALAAQTPAQAHADQATAPQDLASVLGFRYDLPQGWTILSAKPAAQVVNTQPPQAAATEQQKKGTACIQVSLTAKSSAAGVADADAKAQASAGPTPANPATVNPASVIVIVGLPFDCYGSTMSESDLAGFGSGIADGLKQTFDVSGPVTGRYALGSHAFWIERAHGNPKGHPEVPYTVETACTLLEKGAVCWMAMAADEAGLHAFEQATVVLEGSRPTPLIPASTLDKPGL